MRIGKIKFSPWSFAFGLCIAVFADLVTLIPHFLHIDTPFDPFIEAVELPWRTIDRMIWPQQWAYFTPYPRIENGPPEWLATFAYLLGPALAGFVIGIGIGELARACVSRIRGLRYPFK